MNAIRNTALAVLLVTGCALAQDPAPPKQTPTVYRLEYTIVEMDGPKKVSSHTYTMLLEDRKRASTRVGTRVPYATGTSGAGVSTQYNYADVGVNLDSTATVIDASSVRIETTVEVSSLVSAENGPIHAPVIRQFRDQITNIVPLDKVVTITTQDDPTNSSSLQIHILAKLVK